MLINYNADRRTHLALRQDDALRVAVAARVDVIDELGGCQVYRVVIDACMQWPCIGAVVSKKN